MTTAEALQIIQAALKRLWEIQEDTRLSYLDKTTRADATLIFLFEQIVACLPKAIQNQVRTVLTLEKNIWHTHNKKGGEHTAMTTIIRFLSKGHYNRFLMNLEQLGKIDEHGRLDQEYAAALYILTAHLEIWQKAVTYVSQSGINIQEMLEEVDLSDGYQVMVKLAGNLFNGQTYLEPVEFIKLDSTNFLVALNALEVRYSELNTHDFTPAAEQERKHS